jgi:ribonucleoside-diphosphate reductase alpha chain
MDKNKRLLSDITVHNKYAKYIDSEKRRENWKEIIERNKKMHLNKYKDVGGISSQIDSIYNDFVLTKKILPSMRSLQFGGRAIELNNARIYNCAFLPINSIYSFSETMFLLLGGTGIGYSVQNFNIDKLPEIQKPNYKRKKRYIVQDSIIGWADAIKILMKSYTGKLRSHVAFDLSDIREKGAMLVTAGGKAPGPEPLRICLVKIEAILRQKSDGDSLTDIECHDIMCHIADAVLAGGIRRAAMISLFDINSDAMLNAKAGTWWEKNPQRGRANNSVSLLRHKIDKKSFDNIWARIEASGSGEPGIYLTNDKEWGTNPCCEIALRPHQFCNLVEINMSTIVDQEDFEARSKAATFLATLQSGYTDFHYLRDIWKRTTEKDSLIGVSGTGLAANNILALDFALGAKAVKEENLRVSKMIGIKPAARTTCVKPAGTTSLVLGSSSGIHAWHAPYYKRRMRIGKGESLYKYLKVILPKEFLEDEFFDPKNMAVLSIPQKAPDGAITRDESAIDLLERVKLISKDWIQNGHIDGSNSHNVSCTVTVKPDEWKIVGEWMWVNKEYYNGLSVLPKDGGTYKQTPFEDITKEEYESLTQKLLETRIDMSLVSEDFDATSFAESIACSGGSCEIQ